MSPAKNSYRPPASIWYGYRVDTVSNANLWWSVIIVWLLVLILIPSLDRGVYGTSAVLLHQLEIDLVRVNEEIQDRLSH